MPYIVKIATCSKGRTAFDRYNEDKIKTMSVKELTELSRYVNWLMGKMGEEVQFKHNNDPEKKRKEERKAILYGK